MKNKPRTLFLFYILIAYVSLQFVWWTYLIYNLSNEVTQQKEQIIALKNRNSDDSQSEKSELKSKHHRRIIMIGTEGMVFLSLLFFGIYRVKRSLEKENETILQQKNFMLSVTHELKTPLAAIKLHLQTLQKRDLTKEQQAHLLENTMADCNRLNSMIENVLVASRMENTEIKFVNENLELGTVIEDTFKGHVSKDRLVFELKSNLWISADKNLAIIPLVSNLVENALKYSRAKVFIRLTAEADQIVLSVLDQGVGVPKEEINRIFDKFYRVGNEETRNTKGTGLGLFIVKYIVDNNHWKLTVNDNLPAGTAFTVFFPSQKARS
jgi:two-component system phosphate regulon sensor histidine kinase PhoR